MIKEVHGKPKIKQYTVRHLQMNPTTPFFSYYFKPQDRFSQAPESQSQSLGERDLAWWTSIAREIRDWQYISHHFQEIPATAFYPFNPPRSPLSGSEIVIALFWKAWDLPDDSGLHAGRLDSHNQETSHPSPWGFRHRRLRRCTVYQKINSILLVILKWSPPQQFFSSFQSPESLFSSSGITIVMSQ